MAASGFWLVILAAWLDPVGAGVRLWRHGADAALAPPPVGPGDFYRDPDAVRGDQMTRQRALVARRFVQGAQEDLRDFFLLLTGPVAVSLALVVALRSAVEERAERRRRARRATRARAFSDQKLRRAWRGVLPYGPRR